VPALSRQDSQAVGTTVQLDTAPLASTIQASRIEAVNGGWHGVPALAGTIQFNREWTRMNANKDRSFRTIAVGKSIHQTVNL
jgi:hypothetical protein